MSGLRSRAAVSVHRIAARIADETPSACYNITASDELKFVWFRVAKVGTRTTYNRLVENGAKLSVNHAYGHPYNADDFADYFKFAFVRNPWDRLVSCWLNKVIRKNAFEFSDSHHEKMKDFAAFVAWVEGQNLSEGDIHIRAQSSLIDLNDCDFFGRMENFENDLAYVFSKLGLPTHNRSVRNQSGQRKPYQEYYTPELVDQVGEIYSKDIRLFGYKFEG